MLVESVVRSIRAALVVSQALDAQTAARVLDVILEEVTVAPNYPPAPVPSDELLHAIRQIKDLEAALQATRQRAEDAEKRIVELKRGG